MKKKLFSILLSLAMVITMMPMATVTAFADTVTKPDGAEWLVDSGDNHVWYKLEEVTPATTPKTYTLTIGGEGAMPDYTNNVRIRPWDEKNDITGVIIEPGVTSVGDKAFLQLYNLISVSFPAGLSSIGEGAFHKCSSLASITIPNTVTRIDKDAFNGCEKLERLTFQNESQLQIIGKAVFYQCKSLSSITIPNTVTTIDEEAFCECSNLKSVDLPSNLTAISKKVFKSCSSLVSITIPEKVTTIGESAFDSCTKLESVTILGNVTDIVQSAFTSCADPATAVFKATAPPTIAKRALGNIKTVYVPHGCKTDYQTAWDNLYFYSIIDVYEVKIGELTNGTVTSNKEYVETNAESADKVVSLTVNPDAGYQLKADSLTVSYDDGTVKTIKPKAGEGNTYTFTMPSYDVTVTAEFEKNGKEHSDIFKKILIDAGITAATIVTVKTVDAIVKEAKAEKAKQKAAELLEEAKTAAKAAIGETLGDSTEPVVGAYFDEGLEAVVNATTPDEVQEATYKYVNLISEAKAVVATKISQNKLKANKNGKITVSYKAPELDSVVGYVIQRATDKKFTKNVKTYNTKKTTFTNTKNLKKGTKYYYQVYAKVGLSDGNVITTDLSNVRYTKCKKTVK